MFPYCAIFLTWCEDKVNNYSGYSAMQMGLFYKPCKDRKRDLVLSLPDCYHFIWYTSEIISVKPTKVNRDTLLYKYSKHEQNLALKWLIC